MGLGDVYKRQSKIGTQSSEHTFGTKVVKPGFGPNYCGLVCTKRSVCRSLATLREQGNCHRKNTDLPTFPTRLVVFPARSFQSQGWAPRWERTQRGVHPGRGLPAQGQEASSNPIPVSYTHLRAHETSLHLVCRLLLEKKNVLFL